jgi:hypothetical protein
MENEPNMEPVQTQAELPAVNKDLERISMLLTEIVGIVV